MQKFYISREMDIEGYIKTIETLLNNKEAIITLGRQYASEVDGFTTILRSGSFDDEYSWKCLRIWHDRETYTKERNALELRFFLRHCLDMYIYINKDSLFTKKEVYTIESEMFTQSFIEQEGSVYSVNPILPYKVKEVYVGDFLVNDKSYLMIVYASEDEAYKDFVRLRSFEESAKVVLKGNFKSLRRAVAAGLVDLSM